MEVYYFSIRHHKLKKRMELKERKILETTSYLNNDNSQLHSTSYGRSQTYIQFHFYYDIRDIVIMLC